MNTQLQVKTQTTAKGNLVRWVALNDKQVFTVKDTAEMLATTQGAIKELIRRHGLLVDTFRADQVKTLQTQKVVSLKATRVNALPIETVDALVKLVNTSEASEIWNEAIKCLRNPQAYVEARADVAVAQGRSVASELELFRMAMKTLDSVGRLAVETEQRVALVDERLAESPMSLNQITEVQALIKVRYENLGIKLTFGNPRRKTYGSIRFILADVKKRFLGSVPGSMVTYKNIPARDYGALKDFVSTWAPTDTATKYLIKDGCLAREAV